jgi:hypothetical protein
VLDYVLAIGVPSFIEERVVTTKNGAITSSNVMLNLYKMACSLEPAIVKPVRFYFRLQNDLAIKFQKKAELVVLLFKLHLILSGATAKMCQKMSLKIS